MSLVHNANSNLLARTDDRLTTAVRTYEQASTEKWQPHLIVIRISGSEFFPDEAAYLVSHVDSMPGVRPHTSIKPPCCREGNSTLTTVAHNVGYDRDEVAAHIIEALMAFDRWRTFFPVPIERS